MAVVGVCDSGVGVFALRAAAASESPRIGLSTCLGGTGDTPSAPPVLRFGSSNGFTLELGESVDTGECESGLSKRSSFELLSTGEGPIGDTRLGDFVSALELVREPALFDFGTSCSLKPSFWFTARELVSRLPGLGRSTLS